MEKNRVLKKKGKNYGEHRMKRMHAALCIQRQKRKAMKSARAREIARNTIIIIASHR